MDKADRHLEVPGSPGTYVDVHGGWYDATGDYGIHLSHQNPTSYFNPQQTPLVVWSLLRSYEILRERNDDNFNEYERRMLDEGLYGADFLVRIKRPNGSFFESITAPGKKSSHKIEQSATRTGAPGSRPRPQNPLKVLTPPWGRTHSKLASALAEECRLPHWHWQAPCPWMATILGASI